MFGFIREWREKRRAQRLQAQFDDGFGYAMCEYHRYHMDTGQILEFVEEARTFGDYTQFDAGIEEACRAISTYGITRMSLHSLKVAVTAIECQLATADKESVYHEYLTQALADLNAYLEAEYA